jgi:DNA-binding response OmpR family regulator
MRILLVEDEPAIARNLTRGLQEEGHTVDRCDTGADALEQGRALPYDVVLLDWMLPDLDGLAVLRAWRREGLRTPVIMLTARGTTPEKVAGLRAGADDYLPKPFDFEELLARIAAVVRRSQGETLRATVGDLHLDGRRRALVRGEAEASLTGREFALASAFFARPGDVLTRAELLRRVWGDDFDGEPNVVDVYVGYLRRKLALLEDAEGAAALRLSTVRGLGWRLEVGG